MKLISLLIISLVIATTCYSMGFLTIDSLVKDYNIKYGATWSNCDEVSRDFYNVISQNFQKSNLKWIGIKTGSRDPITNKDGHAIVTYTEGRQRFVITTWSKNNKDYKVIKKCVGNKSLHEVCISLIPNYKYIKTYVKGFGFITKSRKQLMMEGGHKVEQIDDVWDRTGKQEIPRRENIWSA